MGKKFAVNIELEIDPNEVLELWSRSQKISVFNCPTWWDAAFKAFGEGRSLVILTIRDQGRLQAYWPFWIKRLGPKDFFVKVIEPVGARMTDYIEPVIAKELCSYEVSGALLARLKELIDFRTILLWSRAPKDDRIRNALQNSFPDRTHVIHSQDQRTFQTKFQNTYGEFERSIPKNKRQSVRRVTRRLKERGDVYLYVAQTRDEIKDRIPVLCEMHGKEWNSRGMPSDLQNKKVREFYELIAENMPIEMLNYSELRFDEKPISIMYNFIYQDMIRLYKIAHDGDFRSFGPGSMHIAELARWGIKNEVAGIDYMEGEEEWKRRWQNESGSTRTFAIASRQGYLVWAWNTKLRKLIIEYKI